MGRTKRCSKRGSIPEAINVEEIRRIRSMRGQFVRLGYDTYTVKISKRLSSKLFFEY